MSFVTTGTENANHLLLLFAKTTRNISIRDERLLFHRDGGYQKHEEDSIEGTVSTENMESTRGSTTHKRGELEREGPQRVKTTERAFKKSAEEGKSWRNERQALRICCVFTKALSEFNGHR